MRRTPRTSPSSSSERAGELEVLVGCSSCGWDAWGATVLNLAVAIAWNGGEQRRSRGLGSERADRPGGADARRGRESGTEGQQRRWRSADPHPDRGRDRNDARTATRAVLVGPYVTLCDREHGSFKYRIIIEYTV